MIQQFTYKATATRVGISRVTGTPAVLTGNSTVTDRDPKSAFTRACNTAQALVNGKSSFFYNLGAVTCKRVL